MQSKLTKFQSVATVNIEVVVTGFSLSREGIEDQTVLAEALFRHAVVTFVIFVTLDCVLECTVWFWTSEGRLTCYVENLY